MHLNGKLALVLSWFFYVGRSKKQIKLVDVNLSDCTFGKTKKIKACTP